MTRQISLFEPDFDAPRLRDRPENGGPAAPDAPATTGKASGPAPEPPPPSPPPITAPAPRPPERTASAPAIEPPVVPKPPEKRAAESKPAEPKPAEAPDPSRRVVLSVSELCQKTQQALEARFAQVWVEGEISACKPHPSGHLYFELKDALARLSCVMWRSDAQRLKFRPADGAKVICRGMMSFYPQAGKAQLYVGAIEPVGQGALHLAFEQLKQRLGAEGLFDPAKKRPLPRAPRVVGVVTSRSGAAWKDIVRVLHRRWPARIVLSHCAVQGATAPAEIVRALERIQQLPEVEVVIVGRGGGSLEDLWAFNDEAVARAIRGCRVPVVSAVGHEIDFTIADFVADRRAATPSNGAELVTPSEESERAELAHLRARLAQAMSRGLDERRAALERGQERLESRFRRALADRRQALDELDARLRRDHPLVRLRDRRSQLAAFEARMATAMREALTRRRARFGAGAARLEALSPLKVLERGYALARSAQGHIIDDAAGVAPGQSISLRLSKGELECKVLKAKP